MQTKIRYVSLADWKRRHGKGPACDKCGMKLHLTAERVVLGIRIRHYDCLNCNHMHRTWYNLETKSYIDPDRFIL